MFTVLRMACVYLYNRVLCFRDLDKNNFLFLPELHGGNGEGTSLGRTIYVVIAIVAVILLGCITVIVYWKVQNSKENVDNSPQNSAAPFAKCSSTQLTDARENTSVQSFVLNEVSYSVKLFQRILSVLQYFL